MPQKILRIATRNSPLALWQANHVRSMLLRCSPELTIELLPMTTSGDAFLNDKLLAIGGKGLFVKELEEALLDERADFAVHSMKDVPTILPKGLGLTTICARDNPLDAFLSPRYSCIDTLPYGASIGTSSLRRQSQLLAHRPDLRVKSLRGNVQTRIAKLNAFDFDAIILAAAGLERLGMHAIIKEIIDDDIMLPACGQGALGIECRIDDPKTLALLSPLNDPLASLCIQSERHVNALLGGNCHVPLAVYCKPMPESQLLLRAKVATQDGKIVIQDTRQGAMSEALALAEASAQSLLAQGAAELIARDICL